uniref:Uncharacterized protein n=1 Tax=Trichobilharzia regenti TaxID=157069 RepID=A0AA85KEN1_TRIRE|nr:unnamed protein product [Trichobilharzia regenti]
MSLPTLAQTTHTSFPIRIPLDDLKCNVNHRSPQRTPNLFPFSLTHSLKNRFFVSSSYSRVSCQLPDLRCEARTAADKSLQWLVGNAILDALAKFLTHIEELTN